MREIVLDRVEDRATLLSYLSGMYGWIVDGLSSLFEPVTRQNTTDWPGKGDGVEAGARRQETLGRPAKRNYQRSVVEDDPLFLFSDRRVRFDTTCHPFTDWINVT